MRQTAKIILSILALILVIVVVAALLFGVDTYVEYKELKENNIFPNDTIEQYTNKQQEPNKEHGS